MKAEDGKLKLTDVADPKLAIERALESYLRKGYSKEWSDQ